VTRARALGLPRLELQRDSDAFLERELHPALVEEVESCGGLWWAADAYTSAEEVVSKAQRLSLRALRLDFRDLSFLDELPDLVHLVIYSDGRPALDPIAGLRHLRALILEPSALRGELDPLGALPELRWLTVPLGGRGGAAVLPSILRGHAQLEHLKVRETKARSVAELAAGFPQLVSFTASYADHLRELGDLGAVAATLRELHLRMVPGFRSIKGIEQLAGLERLTLHASGVGDLELLDELPNLRHADVVTAGGARYVPRALRA
jgi:hypothetical protein